MSDYLYQDVSDSEFKTEKDCNHAESLFMAPHRRRPTPSAQGTWKLIWMRYYGDKNEHTLETMSVAVRFYFAPFRVNNGEMNRERERGERERERADEQL